VHTPEYQCSQFECDPIQWRSWSRGVTWSYFRAPQTNRAAAWRTDCRRFIWHVGERCVATIKARQHKRCNERGHHLRGEWPANTTDLSKCSKAIWHCPGNMGGHSKTGVEINSLQKSSTNLTVNSSPRSSILVIVYITSSLQKPLHAAVIVLEKDNPPFNYPILNSCSLKTVSSIDVYLNLDDCILHYSPLCSLNFVHIVRLILHFILCNWFYVLLLHSIL